MGNIGIACLEELADFDDVIGNGSAKPASKKTSPRKPKANGTAKETKAPGKDKQTPTKETPDTSEKASGNSDNSDTKKVQPGMSEAQKRAIYNLSRRRGISVEELESITISISNLPITASQSYRIFPPSFPKIPHCNP